MDHVEIYKKWDALPLCRIHINIGNGSENAWGRVLPDNTYALDNDPCEAAFSWQDAFTTTTVRSVEDRVYQHWKTMVRYEYVPHTGEDEDTARRQIIVDVIKAIGGHPSFWSIGRGMVLFREQLTAHKAHLRVQSALQSVGITVPDYVEPVCPEDA